MALRYVYEDRYDARGWFDPMLTLAGWLDDELTEEGAAPPTPTANAWHHFRRDRGRR
jgi:hypothetical protein